MSTISGIGSGGGFASDVGKSSSAAESSLNKLSSGKRVNNAADDAAALAILSTYGAQLSSYAQASRNVSDGTSVVDTTDAGLSQTTDLLSRARQLAMQASSASVNAQDRSTIQTELNGVLSEVDRIANSTEYNGTKLLDGSAQTLNFQAGINGSPQDQIAVTTGDARTSTLGVNGLDLSSASGAQDALGKLDQALSNVSAARATYGAAGNRLNSAQETIATSATNLAAADSRLGDVDVAAQASELMSANIQNQAAVATLAQANQSRSAVMRLLG